MNTDKNLPEKPEKPLDLPQVAEAVATPAKEASQETKAPKSESGNAEEGPAIKVQPKEVSAEKTPVETKAPVSKAPVSKAPVRKPIPVKRPERVSAAPAAEPKAAEARAVSSAVSLKSSKGPLEASEAGFEVYVESGTALAKGFEAISAEWLDFTQKAVEANISAAKAFADAKSLDEVVELQARFASRNIDSLLAESAKLTELSLESVFRAWQPISGRVTKTAEKLLKD